MQDRGDATENEAPLPGGPVRGSDSGRPIMAALDLLGRRGALRIVWELREARVLTFRALQAAAELPPGTLNTRLAELRAADIVAVDGGYRLSSRGADLIIALWPLLRWSEDWASALET
ncbi:MAG: transcriptional regulator [Proteobacteria bacterium]|nr:transcriptional regulator [Pseudomonadota bacterium]